MPRCDCCRFYFPHPSSDSPGTVSFHGDDIRGGGQCRRNPPTLSCERERYVSSFPIVFADSWCGAFKPTTGSHKTLQAGRVYPLLAILREDPDQDLPGEELP